jgi:hypothetical protein
LFTIYFYLALGLGSLRLLKLSLKFTGLSVQTARAAATTVTSPRETLHTPRLLTLQNQTGKQDHGFGAEEESGEKEEVETQEVEDGHTETVRVPSSARQKPFSQLKESSQSFIISRISECVLDKARKAAYMLAGRRGESEKDVALMVEKVAAQILRIHAHSALPNCSLRSNLRRICANHTRNWSMPFTESFLRSRRRN